ncbi:MAG: glycoside hydrolase family 43 protein [Alistipes sp.]|nr:glycoside hydrolase family 43 protein [Alistipes sp.]
MNLTRNLAILAAAAAVAACGGSPAQTDGPRYIFPSDYMADPSAHIFDGRIYIYPSHDRISEVTDPEDGAHYDMVDYHVLRMDSPQQLQAEDMGLALSVEDVEWAVKQMWAPDAACKDGRYYLYFPAKDAGGVFRIGVATADTPEGPFIAQPQPIDGAYSIDPAVFDDGDAHYIYFGGLNGGQLQRWRDNELLPENAFAADGQPALAPRVARLSDDMLSLAEPSQPVEIVDADGHPLTANDPHRFFEAAWVHRHDGKYYFSYSTGTTHMLCYATGDSPVGPFVFRGVLLTPVTGWTTHHSIVETGGRSYLFFHDSAPSGGRSSLRSMKIAEIFYNPDGTIQTLDGGRQ